MLLDHLDRIITKCKIDNSNKFLMNQLFFAYQKNYLESRNKKNRTFNRKENNLLIYFYNKKYGHPKKGFINQYLGSFG